MLLIKDNINVFSFNSYNIKRTAVCVCKMERVQGQIDIAQKRRENKPAKLANKME